MRLRFKGNWPLAGALGALLALVPTVAWASPFWPVSAFSSQGRSIQFLFWLVMSIAFVVGLGVLTAIVIITLRFRGRPGDPEPVQRYGNLRLEMWWTALPACTLLVIFIFTVRTMQSATNIAANALDITVIGHQWWWEYRYPGNVVTANDLHVPVGQSVKLNLESADVVHNFWVPVLNGKEQLIPGSDNIWTFTADQPGSYNGACSEYCGTQHAWMLLKVVADPPATFQQWLSTESQPAQQSVLDAHKDSVTLFTTDACGSCHTIAGLSGGKVAPDLTHIGSRSTIGAGVLTNTPDNMYKWLLDAQSYKPGSFMPNFHFTSDQARSMAAFLEDLK